MEVVDTAPVELVRAFHLMWDSFPGVCTLVHKSKTVVASNPAGMAFGREPGVNCSRHGPPESHAGCLAAKALASREPQRADHERDGQKFAVFWLPVEGHDEYYIHFAVGPAPGK